MRTVAILPIKSLDSAKHRLSVQMSAGQRRALAEAMFSDVLVALRRTHSLDQMIVVSADKTAQQVAGGYGATVLDDTDEGHNPAARRAIRHASENGADRVLLVPGDCPLLDPVQVEQLLARNAAPGSAVIVPDRHGTGTNALLLMPPDALAPSFGPGSCRRHLETAQANGTNGEIVDVPSLALDIDTPEDLELLQETLATHHGGAAHTRGMLRQLMRARS